MATGPRKTECQGCGKHASLLPSRSAYGATQDTTDRFHRAFIALSHLILTRPGNDPPFQVKETRHREVKTLFGVTQRMSSEAKFWTPSSTL